MNAGGSVPEEIQQAYNDKLSKGKTIKALLCRMTLKDQIELVKEYPTEGFDHEQVFADIPENECRYVFEDFTFPKEDGSIESKIVYILYCPIAAKPLDKMKHSTSSSMITGTLQAIGLTLQIDDKKNMTYDYIKAKIVEKLH